MADVVNTNMAAMRMAKNRITVWPKTGNWRAATGSGAVRRTGRSPPGRSCGRTDEEQRHEEDAADELQVRLQDALSAGPRQPPTS